MRTKVYCRTTDKGKQTFYLAVGNKEYFLFTQKYRFSVKEYFREGVDINEITSFKNVKSVAVKKTLEKMQPYIAYIEKEYDIAVMNKTKEQKQKKKKPYQRKPFHWQQIDWDNFDYAC